MFRRFCNNASNSALTPAEVTSVEQLSESHTQLLMDEDFADVKSEAGYTACATFLSCVDRAARALNLEVASRSYRATFSANYRALFPDSNRHYRVDVLEASVDQQFAIWVNGEKFELSVDAIGHAEGLQRSWGELSAILERWRSSETSCRSDLANALVAFDVAWAGFEGRYIGELIAIEEQARQLIVHAVTAESDLQAAEVQADSAVQEEAEKRFVRCVQHLNSVANFKRKGRDDLGYDTLFRAREVLQQCQLRKDATAAEARAREAAFALASDVIGSYQAIRQYFRKVADFIEHVDPHLCNNAGLVARLVDWEETWEVGARYVRSAPLLDAICDLVAEIRTAQQIVPELTTMLEDCDVELFMILPRMVVLVFLADPTSRRTELVRSLLPHRFSPASDGNTGAAFMKVDPELKALYDKFKETMQMMASKGGSKSAAWERLVKQAILGDGQDTQRDVVGAGNHVLELLHVAEKWSLELQRHCPEDWNQCSAVLVHCLAGGSQKKAQGKFQV
jgi:hypothetical protein